MRKTIAYAIVAAPLLSTFLWAAFDITWWTTNEEGQLLVLSLIHWLTFVAGVLMVARDERCI